MTDPTHQPEQPTGAEVRAARRRREPTVGWKLAAFLIGCLTAAFFVTLVVVLVRTDDTTQAIRASQKDSHRTQLASAQLLATIRSCTTPGEPCAARNARTLAAAIDTLSTRNSHTAAIAAAAAADCATKVTGFEEIYRCVVHRLAADAQRHRH